MSLTRRVFALTHPSWQSRSFVRWVSTFIPISFIILLSCSRGGVTPTSWIKGISGIMRRLKSFDQKDIALNNSSVGCSTTISWHYFGAVLKEPSDNVVGICLLLFLQHWHLFITTITLQSKLYQIEKLLSSWCWHSDNSILHGSVNQRAIIGSEWIYYAWRRPVSRTCKFHDKHT